MSKTLTLKDFCDAAKELNCEVAAIRAVAQVESAGAGFLPSGKVIILFERHKFAKFTKGVYNQSHPQISSYNPGGYYGGEKEYERFNIAFNLNPPAAMMSASFGKFQLMGFNFAVCGFYSIHAFVDAMKQSEGEQLKAFCEFVETNKLGDELRRKDWAGFARGYNGANYKINNYDGKMLAAYNRYKGEAVDCDKFKVQTISAASAQPSSDQSPLKNPSNLTEKPATEPPITQTEDFTEGARPAEPAPIQVEQIKAESEPDKPVSGINASVAGAVTFITTTGAGLLTWLGGVAWQIVAILAGAAIIVGIIYLINRFWFANREKQREFETRMERERQSFELQKLTLQSAMRKDLNTVEIKPPVVQNSEVN